MNIRVGKTKFLVTVGLFSGIAFILQVIGSFVGLKVGGFLEIELSDLPALILTLAYGPVSGIVCELIKNLLHCTMTSTGFVGELANLTVNGIMCLTAGLIYRHRRTRFVAVWALIFGTAAMAFAGIFTNLYIMLPLYMPDAAFSAKLELVTRTIFPFNILKGLGISAITFLIYKKISRLIK